MELVKWKIPKDKLDNWKRLNPDVPKNIATDCAINVLHFLGVIENREIAEKIAKHKNDNKIGTDYSEILQFIFDSFYNDKDYTEFKINYEIGKKYDEEILNELNNNEYTIALYDRMNDIGHSVLIARLDNEIKLYDPQQEDSCAFQDLNDMIQNKKYVSTRYIIKVRNRLARKHSPTTIKLRKPKSSNDRPIKKRRTSSTPVHSKTRKSQKKLDSISNLVKDFETKLNISNNKVSNNKVSNNKVANNKVANNNTKKRKLSNKSKSESYNI